MTSLYCGGVVSPVTCNTKRTTKNRCSMKTSHDQGNVLFKGQFLRLKKLGRWEYVERCRTTGIVAVLAITEKNEILLVEQFRPPVGQLVIEIPAGLAGDIDGNEGEALSAAAKRELLEETGYQAQTMEVLIEGPSSAGISNEIITFFRAQGLTRISNGGGDDSEAIRVHLVSLTELESWLETKRKNGCAIDYKLYAALYFANSQRPWRS